MGPSYTVITSIPEIFNGFREYGVVGQAIARGYLSLSLKNPREFAHDNHHSIDDRPFGGGDGMVLRADIFSDAVKSARIPGSKNEKVILLSPQGEVFSEPHARRYAQCDHLILVCGRYSGVDERFAQAEADDVISIGDYVLSGGDVAAMAVIEAVSRWVPGVLGHQGSAKEDSFSGRGWLEGPVFTRPQDYQGMAVPEILLSGDHAKIQKWRQAIGLLWTREKRPDLLRKAPPTQQEWAEAEKVLSDLTDEERKTLGFN